MKVTSAAVFEPKAQVRQALVSALKRAGLKVTKAKSSSELRKEQLVLFGPGGASSAKEARAARAQLPSALILAAVTRVTKVAWADGVVPLPLSPKDLSVRLPELARLKGATSSREPKLPVSDSSFLDPLTGFYTFPSFRDVLFTEAKRSRRYGIPLALAVIAFDPMPKVKTQSVREQLFGGLALAIRRSLRDTDFPVRLSADRILLVMPHTPLVGGMTVCQRICERVGKASLTYEGGVLRPTVSVGVTGAPAPGKELSFGELVQEAQQALQRAMDQGGNRVEFHDLALAVQNVPGPEEPG